MRCHICNATLEENEIKWNNDHEDWDPCGTCLAVIEEVFEPLDDDEINRQLQIELEEPIEQLELEGSGVTEDEEMA